jgi:hypothetical protein
MPKFYIESGKVRVVLESPDAQQAAVTAFQWWCEQQAEAMFSDNDENCPLGQEMLVSEIGFGAFDAESFPTLDILMAWQVEPVEVG